MMVNGVSQSKLGDDSLTSNYGSIFILLVLYTLQGIPMGLAYSIPLILQNYNVTYSQQAIYCLHSWPFSLKLLWAPLIDSFYCRWLGRRKSWFIPSQYLIGIVLLLLSLNIDDLLGPLPKVENHETNRNVTESNFHIIQVSTSKPSVNIIAGVFILLDFLCSTQDVAVDGWALTLFSKQNVVYACTCEQMGLTIGRFLGYTTFLVLQSPRLCNKYLRSHPSETGIVTLSGYLFFWSIVFFVVTTLVLICKKEDSEIQTDRKTIFGTYLMVISILKLKYIQLFVFIMLTYAIGFAITTAATPLKLAEAGIAKETLAFLEIPLIPMQIILPWCMGKYTKGLKPLNLFIKVYLFKLTCNIIYGSLLFWTGTIHDPITNSFPGYYYFILSPIFALNQILIDTINVTLISFFNRISDPSIGGTYMTLLNTFNNLGFSWPCSVSLWLLDYTTFKHCSVGGMSCNNQETIKGCTKLGGQCSTTIDGYYVELVILTIIGLIWLIWARKKIDLIQTLPPINWKCS